MKRIKLKGSMLLMLCFTLILGLIPNNIYGNTNYSIDYESYSGFTVPEDPILPDEEVHPKLWFNKSEISDLYNKRLQDDYAATLWNSISTSNYLTMEFPEVPTCESNSSFIHGYYGHMARIAKYNAFMFVMEDNPVHRQRAIEALMRAYDGPIYHCAAIDPTVSGSPIDETYRAMWAQNYAAAYDWVYHELTPEQNEVIREKLAYEAKVTNDNLFIWGPRPHNHRSKPAWGLGSLALVLSDHPDASTWLETGLRAANTNTSYFFSSDGVYREGSQYYIYSHINFVPFLYHYKNVSNVNHFEIFKPAFIWEFHVSNNNGWMPNFADSFLRHNYMHMVASQFMSEDDLTPIHPTAKWGNLFQWRYATTDTTPWGGEFGNNTGASYDDTMDLDKYLTYEPSIEAIKPTGTGTHFFNEGGQTIFRNNWNINDPNSRYLLFQGVAEADNHNHFDHLSFIIHAENQMMASDSGYTRSAYGDAVRREWYRTAPAHNTVTLDGFWPVDMAQNVTPISKYDIDTDFFDFQQKEARFIENENETTRGESRLRFPPDSESLGYFERAIAFPGQDYFVVIDNLRSKTSTPREFDLYLHGGRGIMSGTGNHRLWTYGNDVYGSAAKMATWIFSDGATFSNQEGEVSYVKDDYGMYDYVKASTHAEKTNFIQVLIPLEITKTLPQVTELSDNHRVGGTVAMDGNLDTFVVQQGNQDVTLAELGTNGSFAYVRENGLVQHWSAREATTLSYRGNSLFHSSHQLTLALDQSDRDRYSGAISSEKENFTLSVRKPAGKVADQAIFNGQSVSFENKEGYVHLTGLNGKGDITIIFIEDGERDKISPGNITDLRATDQTSDSVTLTWTAPGNDGDIGAADFYDIRYNTSPITDDNWDDSVEVANEPTPKIAGTSQSMNIDGLRSSTTYYFAMKVGDESLNLSELSNVVAIETDYAPDTTAPANIKDLKVEAVSSGAVNLTWTAPGDDGYFGTADSYEIRYSTQPITEENWDAATLINNPPTPEIVGSHQTVDVADLKAGRSYFFAIKTRDKALNISGLSNLSFVNLPDPDDMKPLEISDVYASSHDGNVPENTIDGNLGTRWSANGDGEWIKYDLGSIQTLSHLKLAWHNGHTRQTFFSIEVSTDNVNWTPILTRVASSGYTSDFEAYELENIHGRYVKLIGHGNSSSTWNSLSETAIYGTVADGLDPITVGNIQFLDRDGKELTALANGDYVQVIAPLTNNQQESQQVLMFMGLYDKKGSLVQMAFINNEINPWETEVLSTGFTLPAKLTGYYVKVSFWDSFDELTELYKEIILEGTE